MTATGVTISGLANSTMYYWRANATTASGTSPWSGVWNFTTIIAAPALASPTNNAAGQATTLNLSWSTVANALSYGLQVAAVSDFSTTAYSSFGITAANQTISGLQTLSTYYWRVNAAGITASSAWSGA